MSCLPRPSSPAIPPPSTCRTTRATPGAPDPASRVFASYDAKPEVELHYTIATTYAIDGAGGGGLTVEGRATASGEADRATVVVLPSLDFSTTTGASQAEANRRDPHCGAHRSRHRRERHRAQQQHQRLLAVPQR